jgi:hypothetical protein
MLIIVDEFIKANNERAVQYDATAMRELGIILNSDGRTDILVSSLFPTYIDTLMTGSNRLVDDIPLRPLPLDQLGMSEFKPFAEAMISDVDRKMKSPSNELFLYKIVANYSGSCIRPWSLSTAADTIYAETYHTNVEEN